MRTTTAVIATLALLCVGATGVVAQETDEVAPAAEPSVYFTGTFENTGLELPDPIPNLDTGVLEVRGGWIEFMTESEDPRIAGPYRIEPFHMDIDPLTGIGRMFGTGHVIREDGAFEGPIRGVSRPLTEEVDAYTASGWLTGSGAYEGLTYFYRATYDGEEAFAEGIVFGGEAPPLE